jgi:TPR repeat protein
MRTKQSQSLRLRVLLLSLLPSIALADAPAPAAPAATAPATPAAPPAAKAATAAPEYPFDPPASLKIEQDAEKALDRQDLDIAIPLFTKAAEMNNLRAQVNLGELAEQAQMYDDAVGWYLTAAMQGDPQGMFSLGNMYLAGKAADGSGIEKDENKAVYWIRRSAEKKFGPAERSLADAYRGGLLGLKVDPEKAAFWDARAKREEEAARRAFQENLKKLAESQKELEEEQRKKAEAAAKK